MAAFELVQNSQVLASFLNGKRDCTQNHLGEVMNRLKSLGLVLVALFLFSGPAQAEFFSIGVDAPVAFAFNDSDTHKTDGMPSGYMLSAKLPILVGFGVENYSVPMQADFDLSVDVNFYDLFYTLPIPFINLTFGYGFGSLEYKCTYQNICDSFDKANASQAIGQIGIPIALLFDLHVGYRKINATLKENQTGTSTDWAATATSVGISFGF
ncbi:MAG: hypothetical protein A2527_14015 [Candidatus Lambdaproteobacteria bacterium RIFOXYD2_FULL_50_16]|uniref:Outer membrane protein beta-barrel domain-containing protein n=1 Tax=Candidatus Lambdaproteobacteria bacterium RIFOXYD2_FULL_50_16 TaxID=1817772 RepID=A0A1F6G4K7_9PROT|nr:MAG: hypothetical protein A2527_14015 [Candidatus Lambdaproteobacteria bacterium RIFOXYD2_FULL_50_16]